MFYPFKKKNCASGARCEAGSHVLNNKIQLTATGLCLCELASAVPMVAMEGNRNVTLENAV